MCWMMAARTVFAPSVAELWRSSMAKEQKEPKEKKAKKEQPKEQPVEVQGKGPVPRLKEKFHGEILPLLLKRDQYKNVMAVPRLQKIVVNMGVGEASKNIKV